VKASEKEKEDVRRRGRGHDLGKKKSLRRGGLTLRMSLFQARAQKNLKIRKETRSLEREEQESVNCHRISNRRIRQLYVSPKKQLAKRRGGVAGTSAKGEDLQRQGKGEFSHHGSEKGEEIERIIEYKGVRFWGERKRRGTSLRNRRDSRIFRSELD